ncbi:transglycosylase domain-containing protein [Salicibibacter cibi]|uniref:Transglycosylase domain-containing protein n=1 Tax=Salicibibacter cibi TaxID=2743001 RepID=A0A7T6ZDK0_9BACI|nr:transglycosylase domain-containing protein [Salicibibacter cibi]QQK81426.1 transglycosylase domain-containing protein [Salicibibacter cibi]
MQSNKFCRRSGLNEEKLKFTEGATIYDMNDNEHGRLQGSENHSYRDIDDMPEHLKNAFIVVEDYRFYEHSGVFKCLHRCSLHFDFIRDVHL